MSQQGGLSGTGGGGGLIVMTLTGNTGGAVPATAGNINVVGDGINVTTSGTPLDSTLTISLTGSGLVHWNVVSTSQVGLKNNGYVFIAPGGALTVSLPAVSSVGDVFIVTLDGAASIQITQGAGQQIRSGNGQTTAGVFGSLTSTQQGDALTMVCSVANLKWNVLSSMGNPTIV